MSFEQKAGENNNIKIGNKCFESVVKFEYLGTVLIYENYIHEEIKSREYLLSSSAECFVVQFAIQKYKD
jgi:hypothetical protein